MTDKKRIYYYCQHVLGVGHFFRSLEICRALGKHAVTMITGGTPVDIPLPPGLAVLQLPDLMMDTDFSRFYTTENGCTVETVKAERIKRVSQFVAGNPPDVFLVELYPFGRKAFRFELDPVLGLLRKHHPSCLVVCSLRDILVEKKNRQKYESRVVETLNRYFDLLLVHADPGFVRLDETFSRMDDIRIPVAYTGYVAPAPGKGAGRAIRQRLKLTDNTSLIVASAGGGSVGGPLLTSVCRAFAYLAPPEKYRLQLFCGPFLDDGTYRRLLQMCDPRLGVERFSDDFLSWMAAADLSVSMAGYNTCMNILASGTPAIVWPFRQNREQHFRAGRLQERGILRIASDDDLAPGRLAGLMQQVLSGEHPRRDGIQTAGAARTAAIVEKHFHSQQAGRAAVV